jgi:plasmid stabilization system protein ParE
MDEDQLQISIVYSLTAVDELDEIWDWNVKNSGFDQAVAYRKFLLSEIESLQQDPKRGVPLEADPNLRFLLIKWSANGHGHVAVYRFAEVSSTITIAHIFHTRQNWRTKLN